MNTTSPLTYFFPYALLAVLLVLVLEVSGQNTFNKRYDFWGGRDLAQSMIVDSSGYYIVGTGMDYTKGGSYSVKLLHLDTNGNVVWQKSYGETGLYTAPGGFKSMKRDAQGNIYVVGTADDSILGLQSVLAKFNSNGDSLWFSTLGDVGRDVLYSLDYDDNTKTIYTVGYTAKPPGPESIRYAVWDTNGQLLVSKRIGTVGYDGGVSISKVGDSLVIGSISQLPGGLYQSYAYVIDSALTNNRRLDDFTSTTGNESVRLSYQFGMLVAIGKSNGLGAFVALVDSNFEIQWRTFISDSLISRTLLFDITILSDSSIIAVGSAIPSLTSIERGVIFKFDKNGAMLWWRQHFSYPEDTTDIFGSCTFNCIDYDENDNSLIVAGQTIYPDVNGSNSLQDFWVVKLDTSGCFNAGCTPISSHPDSMSNYIGESSKSFYSNRFVYTYPNPSQGIFTVMLRTSPHEPVNFNISDLMGRLVFSDQQTTNTYGYKEWLVDMSVISSGVYLYNATDLSGNIIGQGKLVVE